MLEVIRDYGRVDEWPALVLDGEEIIPAGRADWLDFVWLSHKKGIFTYPPETVHSALTSNLHHPLAWLYELT